MLKAKAWGIDEEARSMCLALHPLCLAFCFGLFCVLDLMEGEL